MTKDFCEHKNKATSAVPIRGKYRTFCIDCNQEIDETSRIAEIFKEMEGYKY
jgi:hypothetical protein